MNINMFFDGVVIFKLPRKPEQRDKINLPLQLVRVIIFNKNIYIVIVL